MATRNPFFRENYDRAVYLRGEINDELVRAVTWDFLRLPKNADPVTVLIESQGGSINSADELARLFSMPDQDGNRPRIVTVVHNFAASAAAHILVTGSYALAYPGCVIHMHGSRLMGAEVTRETAADLANRLKKTNASRALVLARRVFQRTVFLFGCLKEEIENQKQKSGKTDLEVFSDLIAARMTKSNRRICQAAYKNCSSIVSLVSNVMAKLAHRGKPPETKLEPRVYEGDILKSIIDYKLKTEPETWEIRERGLSEIAEDFLNLWDYLIGEHNDEFLELMRPFASAVLSEEKMKELKALSDEGKVPNEWYNKHVYPVLEPFWYYTVCLTRCLQSDENPLSAMDAYWLGLVDEVVGRPVPSLRTLIEAQAATPPS